MSGDPLKDAAQAALSHAYAPYSHFRVGAALRATDGRVFSGSNVENAAYGVGMCAERSAMFSAVSQGARTFEELVLVSDAEGPAAPCGACRQALAEFAPALPIRSIGRNGEESRWTLAELLPYQFSLDEPNGKSE